MDGGNPQLLCGAGAMQRDRLSVDLDVTVVVVEDSREHVDQRGLACSVFSQQCHNFTGAQAQRHIIECSHS